MVTTGTNLRPRSWLIAGTALIAVFALRTDAQAQLQVASSDRADARAVTFSGDVAEIVFNNCTRCHREGGIGPMELVSYQDVRRYATRIRYQVGNGLMPPYAYDRDVGIQDLKEDWRLSPDQIQTVVDWVDQGAPLGDADEVPPLPAMPDASGWAMSAQFGPPDIVVRSTPIDVPTSGNDMWHRPVVPVGLTEDRCIRAVQVKPAGNAAGVVHHAIAGLQVPQPDGSIAREQRATEYAMGKFGEIMPDNVCRKVSAGAEVVWDIHLFPGGLGANATDQVIPNNVVELGIWLQPEGFQAEYDQDLSLYGFEEGQTEMLLPPHTRVMTQGYDVFDHPVRIDSWQPHGHLRLRAASLEIFYPETGRTEVVSMVSNWSAVWHQSHIYADDSAPLIPAGAVLIQKNWYDNTAENPNNPDPDQWVNYGSRTADEMSHGWMAVTHLDEEGYQRLLSERQAKQTPVSE
jgi:hypothetical protein